MHLEETSAIDSVWLGCGAQSLMGKTGIVIVLSIKPKGAKLETGLHL